MNIFIKKLGSTIYHLWSRFLDIFGNIKIYKWPMFIIYDDDYFRMTGDRIAEAL